MKAKNNYFQLFRILASTDFKMRYNGSVLGFLWALLKPLLIFLVLNFVFSNIFGVGDPYFSVKLLLGIMLWNFFSEGTMTAMLSLASKGHILTKTNVSKIVIVAASAANALLTFLINIGILAIFFVFADLIPSILAVLVFFGYSLLLLCVIFAFGLLASPLYLKFRDLNQIWEVLLTAGFYACPIIYPLEVIPESFRPVLLLNPMTFIIQHSKMVLVEENIGGLNNHLVYIAVVLAFLFLSYVVFRRQSKFVAEYI